MVGERGFFDGGGVGFDQAYRPDQAVEAYWQALRTGPGLPARADVDPRGLDRVLEYAFIAEQIAPGLARFRVAGRHLCGTLGMEVRGMPVSCILDTDGRRGLEAVLTAVFGQPAKARLDLRGTDGATATMTCLPLVNERGAVTRVLGAFVADGPAPCAQFSLCGHSITPIAEGEVAPLTPPPPAPALHPGFAEASGVFFDQRPDAKRKGPAQRPALKLVVSNDQSAMRRPSS